MVEERQFEDEETWKTVIKVLEEKRKEKEGKMKLKRRRRSRTVRRRRSRTVRRRSMTVRRRRRSSGRNVIGGSSGLLVTCVEAKCWKRLLALQTPQ